MQRPHQAPAPSRRRRGPRAPSRSLRAPGGAWAGALLGLLLIGTAVAPRPAAGAEAWYIVREGDMLGIIAARLGTSVSGLRRANGLRSDLIRVGQRLRVTDPFARGGSVDWRCPLDSPGPVLRGFGPHENAQKVRIPHTGVDLQTSRGSRVHSPGHGVVRYVGHQDDYGTVVILEHAGGWSTVLAPLAPGSLRVEPDQVVLRGDLLGLVGEPQELGRDYLHVELRRRGRAVDPAPLRP